MIYFQPNGDGGGSSVFKGFTGFMPVSGQNAAPKFNFTQKPGAPLGSGSGPFGFTR